MAHFYRATRPAAGPNFTPASNQGPQGAVNPNAIGQGASADPSSMQGSLSDMQGIVVPQAQPAYRPGTLPMAAVAALPARPGLGDDPIIPPGGFPSHEEAEKAFVHLLKKAGIDPTWTWDRTMRAIITDPLYKALSTLAEKKAAWEKVSKNLALGSVLELC